MPNISLSFDDSRKDFFTNVFPLLKKYKIPATLNVITARVEKSDPNNADRHYMTVAEVKECADSGLVEIASHSANHRNDRKDIILSINKLSDWLLGDYGGGGYASPFSELTLDNSKEKGIYELIETGHLRYIRSGTRTRREGLLFAATQYVNQYLHSPLLYRLMNRKYVINKLQVPFLPSVAIHHDTTVRMVQRFVQSMSYGQSVVFCLHGILKSNEKGYNKHFNLDYDQFEQLLNIISLDKSIVVKTTLDLVADSIVK